MIRGLVDIVKRLFGTDRAGLNGGSSFLGSAERSTESQKFDVSDCRRLRMDLDLVGFKC